jgi:hypothetical protein
MCFAFYSSSFYLKFVDANPMLLQKLRTRQRVLCWVMTHPNNHETKARAVKHTWARFCDKTLFFTNGAAGIYKLKSCA